MIKPLASIGKSDEVSGSEELVARKGLNEIVSQQYTKALDLQRKGKLQNAIQLLKDLLGKHILCDIKKPAPNTKVQSPLFLLKYLCYKNLAAMLSKTGEVEAAIEAYCSASELDDTDVTLWHQLGLLYIRVKHYEPALAAFKRGCAFNKRYWPCLDKVVMLSLGLDLKEECTAVINDALQLDPCYLRGLVYKRHMKREKENGDMPIDEEKAAKLLKEADEIREICIQQQKEEQLKHTIPYLKLNKPITLLSWEAVGEALIDMHHYITEKCLSYACPLEFMYSMEKSEVGEEKFMEPDVGNQQFHETATDSENIVEIVLVNENNDVAGKDTPVPEKVLRPRKGYDSSTYYFLSTFSSTRVYDRRNLGLDCVYPIIKPANNEDESIYDTLRKLIPIGLVPKIDEKEEESLSVIVVGSHQCEEKQEELEQSNKLTYFDSENEVVDVKLFINKYTEKKHNIIDILRSYLTILAGKWRLKWPRGLVKVFVEANKYYNTHCDIPACTDDNKLELIQYTSVNLLAEELIVNDKLDSNVDDNDQHDLSVVESIGIILSLKPDIFSITDCLEYIIRQRWVKLHIHKLNKCDSLELETLNGLLIKFHDLKNIGDTYNLNVINFTFKPEVNVKEVIESLTFIERNMKLKTIKNLYDKGNYEEVLTIVIDCFEHFKTLAKQQKNTLSLHFDLYLTIILDTYWVLGKVEDCFKSCFACLHEVLHQTLRYNTGSAEYEKWTRIVSEILCTMEHILSTKGLSCLDALTEGDLSQGLEDLIKIIGHQLETKAAEIPFDTFAPWIIMYYILKREEDQGRGETSTDPALFDYVPYPLMVLFIGHAKLGKREWCSKYDGKLLHFILDTVVPQLGSPSLSKCLEIVRQFIEQCTFCLYGYHMHKYKCLEEHNGIKKDYSWRRAQQLYDLYCPTELSRVDGKISVINSDVASLFTDILKELLSECDPAQYIPEMEAYMEGIKDKLPAVQRFLPYKMKDIYFLLGDYFLNDNLKCIKYSTLDVIINKSRFESWARIAMCKARQIHKLLYSDKFGQCNILKTNKKFLNLATTAIRCFKRSLHLDPTRCNVWIEYGNFVYAVHSFCSRLLKQARESIRMKDFESLEKQKEDMLDTAQKCFNTVLRVLNNNNNENLNERKWLCYYMLGKVAEKRNKSPSVYLDYYMQGIKSLIVVGATYPTEIHYSSPPNLCIEVLELHYRLHASILKYIEQHENKAIPESVGNVFASYIAEWLRLPLARRTIQDGNKDTERETNFNEPVQAVNILKRSVRNASASYEVKRVKLDSAAAKVRRPKFHQTQDIALNAHVEPIEVLDSQETKNIEDRVHYMDLNGIKAIPTALKVVQNITPKMQVDSSSSTSFSTSNRSSESGRDSDSSKKSSNESKSLTEDETMKIVSACLDALEDCASRFPRHYKAIFRLAHYHFCYKKGRDIERCRDLMLSTFTSRFGQELGGLFSERKKKDRNLFNTVWKIPLTEVDRGGSFPFHMNRSVLLTLEILKEIDDHKTLLELRSYLRPLPIPKYKCLPNPDRETLAEQAFSLYVHSLKGQLIRFSQQTNLESNDVERSALKSLMLQIYAACVHVPRLPNSKQFLNLLVDSYKLLRNEPLEKKESLNFIKEYCRSLLYPTELS